MDDAVARFADLKKNITKLQAYRSVLRTQGTRLEAEKNDATRKSELYQRCSEIFKRWLEESLEKNVHSMAELATIALKHVIPDQDLTLKIVQEAKYNRMAIRFLLEQKEGPELVEGDPLDSYGGGASAVVSLVLRLAVMSRMRMGNLLLLDESMSFVANAYVPNAAAFMRHLAEETGVNILMVTHNPEFMANAHTAYEGHKDGSLKLRRLKSSDSV